MAAQQCESETLSKLCWRGMAEAECNCCKLKMGDVPWSPKYDKAKVQIRFWQLMLRQKEGKLVKRTTIR